MTAHRSFPPALKMIPSRCTTDYISHKQARFHQGDEQNITQLLVGAVQDKWLAGAWRRTLRRRRDRGGVRAAATRHAYGVSPNDPIAPSRMVRSSTSLIATCGP
jgi:hypothetical protein